MKAFDLLDLSPVLKNEEKHISFIVHERGSFSKMAYKDTRNFRAFYNDTLGLRNVELKKALEKLLKDDAISSVK